MNLNPSTAHRYMACHASATLPGQLDGLPDSRRDTADEGVAAHEVANLSCKDQKVIEGSLAKNGHVITQDMIDGADTFAYYARWVNASWNAGGLEEKIALSSLGIETPGIPDAWGVMNERALHVYEYKYGHSAVTAFENWQMLIYAAALRATKNLNIEKVHLHVIQPRLYNWSGPIDTWVITNDELSAYEAHIIDGVEHIKAGSVTASVGSHCKYCPARFTCDVIRRAGMHSVDVAKQAVDSRLPVSILGMELSEINRAMETLKNRKSGIEEVIIHSIKKGQAVTGWQLKQEMSALKWELPTEAVLALGTGMQVDLSKPQEPITPTQAVKKCPTLTHMIDSVAKRHPGELKLKQLTRAEIRKAFKK